MTDNKPFVKIRNHWPGAGQLVDVRVKMNQEWVYTTVLLKPGDRVVDLVRRTRENWRRAQNGR